MVPPAPSENTASLALSISQTGTVPRMSTEPVLILKVVKVLCFDTLLEVLILKGVVGGRARAL
jgi:hypothetical protein